MHYVSAVISTIAAAIQVIITAIAAVLSTIAVAIPVIITVIAVFSFMFDSLVMSRVHNDSGKGVLCSLIFGFGSMIFMTMLFWVCFGAAITKAFLALLAVALFLLERHSHAN